VKFDRSKLGFDPDATLKAADAVTREAVAFDGDTVTLDVLPELFRLVKIAAPDELGGKNLDPKHPDPMP
jgi:hypothetical protein